MFQSIVFLGLGLIGGSIAKALRRVHPQIRIDAYDPQPHAVRTALSEGVIDQILTSLDSALANYDLIFLCMPVHFMEEVLSKIKQYAKPSALITDVGSTKTPVHEVVCRLGLEDRFIGGHPMAGSERSGYTASTTRLLENAYYVLTPPSTVPHSCLEALTSLLSSLGAIPMIMDAQKHDRSVAGVSHLPHIIAASLVNLIQASDDEGKTMKHLASGGFKDITRIASSSPSLWEHICLDNQESVTELLEQYIASLSSVLTDLRSMKGPALYQLFDTAAQYRSSLPDNASGALSKEHALYCDIADQTGAIATVSTVLANHQISLKNIGIVHNRDFEEGVLKIVFYHAEDCRRAANILRDNRYTIYEKK